MFRKIEKLSEAIDRNVKDALFEDIGFGDRAEAIIPAKNVIAEVKCNTRRLFYQASFGLINVFNL